MNILKPQEIFLKNLTEASFIDEISKKAEKDVFSKISFTDETVANVKLFDITFEYCKFTNINMEQGKLEKTTFSDVIFTNCNFSNTKFLESNFIRCEFNNCKIAGSDFTDARFYNVGIIEANANYINLSMASLERVLFKNTTLKNSYFSETTL